MAKEESKHPAKVMMKQHPVGGGAYFFGFVGALVYFIQHATTLQQGLIGFLKACVWPGVIVYKLLEFLNL